MAAEVSKGDVFIAGGTSKKFKVYSVKNDGLEVTLKEIEIETPEKPDGEEIVSTVDALKRSDDWIGLDVG